MTKSKNQKKKGSNGNNAKPGGGESSNGMKSSAAADTANAANGNPVVVEKPVDPAPAPSQPVKQADVAIKPASQVQSSAHTSTSKVNQKQEHPHANGSSRTYAAAAKQVRTPGREHHPDGHSAIEHNIMDGHADTAGLLKARAHLISSVNLLEESLRACRSREVAEEAAITSLLQENVKLKESRTLAAVFGFGSGITVAAVLAASAFVLLRSSAASSTP